MASNLRQPVRSLSSIKGQSISWLPQEHTGEDGARTSSADRKEFSFMRFPPCTRSQGTLLSVPPSN